MQDGLTNQQNWVQYFQLKFFNTLFIFSVLTFYFICFSFYRIKSNLSKRGIWVVQQTKTAVWLKEIKRQSKFNHLGNNYHLHNMCSCISACLAHNYLYFLHFEFDTYFQLLLTHFYKM